MSVTCHFCGGAMDSIGVSCRTVVYKCKTCEVLQVPVSDADEYREVYESGSYYTDLQCHREGYSPEERYRHDLRVHEVRARNLTELVPPPARVLDVGCGNGAFCRTLIDGGYEVFGVDPDPGAVAFAAGRIIEAKLVVGDVFNTPSGWDKFDAVVLIDSFEHALEPTLAMRRCAQLLVDGGLVLIETPHYGCIESQKFGVRWKHVKPEEHPFLYSRKALLGLMESSGLCSVGFRYTIPGKIMAVGVLCVE